MKTHTILEIPYAENLTVTIDDSSILIALILMGFMLLVYGGILFSKYRKLHKVLIVSEEKIKELEEEPHETPEKIINLNDGQEAISFLERLISDKYNYYLYQDLLPIYLDSKIPERTVVKKVKEKIYASIVGSLTPNVKQELLRFFTQKGIEIFVNEKIITLMNETDFRSSDKLSESFREITANNVDRII